MYPIISPNSVLWRINVSHVRGAVKYAPSVSYLGMASDNYFRLISFTSFAIGS